MQKNGFTKIELLVTLAIIGILGATAAIALNSAREQARDAKRLSDIARLQTSLELYFNDHNSYPIVSEPAPLGQTATRCLGGSGFVPSCDQAEESVYFKAVPTSPASGLGERVTCGGVDNAYCYQGSETAYRMEFELENDNPEAKLTAGINCASESGIKAGACTDI